MTKHQRIADLVASLAVPARGNHDPRYLGYFACFNAGLYYEAHDVLEDLWLRDKRGRDGAFFKGLIQLAGAFVHLKKQRLRPTHPKDRGRLAPASRLLALARRNLTPFAPQHLDLDVAAACRLCDRLGRALAASRFRENPWDPLRPPRLRLA